MPDLLQKENSDIKKLVKKITKYQKSYYNGESEVSDAEFDLLWDKLKSIDPDNPVLHKVGADSGNFKKIHHLMPMGSQEKAADPQKFLEWADKHIYPEYLVEYKLDGASLELQYTHGVLTKAVTRGNGTIGDDITANASKMKGVMPALVHDNSVVDFTGGIRGEVIMAHSVHETYFSDKANCRNAANGLMKRKDGKGCENLQLIVYDALSRSAEQPFRDEKEKIKWLKTFGFDIVPLHICHTAKDVIEYRAEIMQIRATLDYDIDGLVVKESVINIEDAARARPDRQIAFKFSLEEAVTTLREIDWSESGSTYTPVAVFDPVELAGTIVKRASLANPDTIRALGIRIGSNVVVVKRGEIIPKIESVLHDGKKTEPILFPAKCSVCGTDLIDEGSRLFCPNKECPKRILHQLYKWVDVVDIRDLGETLIKSLFDAGILHSIGDIYKLSLDILTPFFLNEQSIASEKESLGAQKVLVSIKNHTNIPIAVFIAGFDIEGIGETTAEKLVSAGYNTLEKMLSASEEDFMTVYGFASVMAHTAVEGLKDNEQEMRSLIEKNVLTIIEGPLIGSLSGKSFCFTGELVSIKRADAQKKVKSAGGLVKSSVTKDLSYLVTNNPESGSSKNKKAAEMGVTIITETEFLSLVH